MFLPETSVTSEKKGFTLIELLIVITILGILAAAIMVAINPARRMAQARDAKRKSDINAIANALVGFYTLTGGYPRERACDTSRGIYATPSDSTSWPCTGVTGSDWNTTEWINDQLIHEMLVVNQAFLKRLPIDPINNITFYYKYEPRRDSGPTCAQGSYNYVCTYYWIGVRLEAPSDPLKVGKIVFRCSDDTNLAAGVGCKEVEFPNTSDFTNFDYNLVSY